LALPGRWCCWAPAGLPRAAHVDAGASVNWPDEPQAGRRAGAGSPAGQV
jgi:hypothetical protein